jgi:hypothetical protein
MNKGKTQNYYNIASGVTIALLIASIMGAWGFIVKINRTVNKADLALKEISENEKTMNNKTRVLHNRISKLEVETHKINDLTVRADERSNCLWMLYLKE